MSWGNIYLQGSRIHKMAHLGHGDERHLVFSSYDPMEEPVMLIHYATTKRGSYCAFCQAVYFDIEESPTGCAYCGNTMLFGEYYIIKSVIGRFFKHTLSHLYFASQDNKVSLKILNGDDFVRGFYCKRCGIVWFDSKERQTYSLS